MGCNWLGNDAVTLLGIAYAERWILWLFMPDDDWWFRKPLPITAFQEFEFVELWGRCRTICVCFRLRYDIQLIKKKITHFYKDYFRVYLWTISGILSSLHVMMILAQSSWRIWPPFSPDGRHLAPRPRLPSVFRHSQQHFPSPKRCLFCLFSYVFFSRVSTF